MHLFCYATQVGTNGYFTFDEFTAFTFSESTTIPLVAPFFADNDISFGVGEIIYEVHTESTSESIISYVNSIVNQNHHADFEGKWMLVATWSGVPPFSGFGGIVSLLIICIYQTNKLFHRQTPTREYW